MVESETQKIDLSRYIRVLRSNLWIAIVAVTLSAGGVYVWSNGRPPIYEATVLVRAFDVSGPSSDSGDARIDPIRELDTQVLYARSPAVISDFRSRMGAEAGRIESTSVAAVPSGDAIRVVAQSGTRKLAQDGAGTYAQVFVDRQRAALAERFGAEASALRGRADAVQNEISAIDTQIKTLEPTGGSRVVTQNGRAVVVPESNELRNLASQRETLVEERVDLLNQATDRDIESGNRQSDIDIVQAPVLPMRPVSPLPRRDAAVAGLVGLLVGLGTIAVRDRRRQPIMTSDDVKAAVPEIQFVTPVPSIASKQRRNQEPRLDLDGLRDGQIAESYRALRVGLRFAHLDESSLVLLVTSAQAGEGKTTTVADFGVSLALSGERVILVDCDLRRPNLHAVFDRSNEAGFSSVVTGRTPIYEAMRTVKVGNGSVAVLTAGPPVTDPPAHLMGQEVEQLWAGLKSRYSYIIIDSPPVLSVTDARALAPSVDAVLLTARAGQTSAAAFREADRLLRQLGTPIHGAVLVGARVERSYGDYTTSHRNDGRNPLRSIKLPTKRNRT